MMTSAFASLHVQLSWVSFRAVAGCMVLSLLGLLQPAQAQTTVAGNVPGEFAVAPSGAATYRIPIQVPPGVAGMEPKLALSYNSQGGNGVMGMGWSIEGLSAITRCPQTMASDGVRGRLNHNALDVFCLDGQRLIVVGGSYGVADSEYRTEIDGFGRIRAVGMANGNAVNGPASFVVQTKAGLTLEYGSTPDSQIEAQGKSVVRVWAVSRMTDAKGNTVSFTYTENSAQGEYQISSISYGINSVWFTYEARPDTMVGYEVGAKVGVQQRLKEVETRIGSNTVYRTKVSYSFGATTGRSRVQSITLCAADGTCFAPATFNHSDSAELGSFQAGTRVVNESTVESSMGYLYTNYPGKVKLTPKFADLNGDGVTDLLYAFASPSGAVVYRMMGKGDGSFLPSALIINVSGFGTTEGCTPELADLNGDGKVDLLYICPRSSGVQVIRWLGNGDGSFQPESRVVNVTGLGSFAGYIPHMADINGDGIVDLLLTFSYSTGAMAYKWIGKGDGTFQAEALSTKSPGTIVFDGFTPRLADLNGDGLLDLVYVYTGSFGVAAYWFPNNGEGSFHAPQLVVNTNAYGNTSACRPELADLNGDGTVDLLYACAQSNGAFAYAWMGNGDGSFQTGTVVVSTTGLGSFSGYVPHLADLNADGVPDLIFTGADIGVPSVRTQRWMGRGDGRFFDSCCALVSTELGSFADFTPMVTDLNGDGIADLFYYVADYKGGFAYLWRGKGVLPDRLTSISTPSGTSHEVNYRSTLDRSVYTPSTTVAYPYVDAPFPIQVVSSVNQNNGLGGLNATTYRYSGWLYENIAAPGSGRGPLGFRSVESVEQVSGIKTYVEYRQAWPYLGMSHFSQTIVAGSVVKQTATTFSCTQTNAASATTSCGTPAPGKVYFPFAVSSTEKSWDLTGAAMPTIATTTTYGGTTDTGGKTLQLGDVTALKVELLDGSVIKHRKTTTNQFTPANLSGSNWISGRLSRASVTSYAPELPPDLNTRIRTSSFEYDALGLLSKEVVEPDRPQDCLQTTHAYDVYGNRVSSSASACAGASGTTLSSASAARTTTGVYGTQTVTASGATYTTPAGIFLTQSTNALGQSEAKEYDPRFGSVTKLTGPNGLATTWTYDRFARKTIEVRADGTRTQWQHLLCAPPGLPRDAACPASVGGAVIDWYVIESQLSSAGAALAPPKLQFYDTLGRVVRVQTQGFDGGGSGPTLVQDTVYNSKGQVTQKSVIYLLAGGDPKWTTYTYDAMGRVLSETIPDGSSTATTSFGYNGLVTGVINAKGQKQTKYRNASGQVIDVKDPLGYDILYTYDALGQLVQTTATGSSTKLSYDQRGRKIRMEDPAMGVWDYAYNAFGELVWQQDSLGHVTTMEYDVLGRLRKRIEPDLVSEWSYDKKFDATGCGKGIGKLCEARADNGYRRVHSYDSLSRAASTATALDSSTVLATVSQTYDAATGRLATQTWPTGYKANYSYTTAGFLKKVAGSITGDTRIASLEILAIDPQGRITQYRQGNNVTTVKNFDAVTSKLNSVQATASGASAGNILNHSYSYDSLGNLTGRQDANTGLIETFGYDNLSRLTLATVSGGGLPSTQSTQVLYDSLGNIKYKSDVGYYNYDPVRSTRLAQITSTRPSTWSAIGTVTIANTGTRALAYAFDDARTEARSVPSTGIKNGNGNLWYTVSQDSASGRHTVRWETYTSFNHPQEIKFGNLTTPDNPTNAVADRTLSFLYGAEHQRIKQTVTLTSAAPSSMEAGTTWYLNGNDSQSLAYEKEIKANGTIEHKHYLNAGGISFAMYVKREGNLNGKPAASLSYWHHDHLGSLVAISSETGALVERLAFDPWGKRRYANGTADVNDQISSTNTDRGYTQHEHLDEVGVIHMNGRVYDPLIGRFMSADPFVQSPENLQSYNRYAYVLNNPLAFTDPSGFKPFWKQKWFRQTVVTVAIAVASYYTAGLASGWYEGMAAATVANGGTAFTVIGGVSGTSTLISGTTMGFVGSLLNSKGDIVAGLKGAVGGVITGGVSGYFGSSYSLSRVLANSIAGGIEGRLQGRSFLDSAKFSFAFSALAYVNSQMRNTMIEQSKLDPRNDGSGLSKGMFGDGFKLAGGRWNPFEALGVTQCSSLGCLQSGPGSAFGVSYSKGSFIDMVTESFAGPHDSANAPWFYSPNGLIRDLSGTNVFALDLATNYTTSLAFAAPLAAGPIYEQLNLGAYQNFAR